MGCGTSVRKNEKENTNENTITKFDFHKISDPSWRAILSLVDQGFIWIDHSELEKVQKLNENGKIVLGNNLIQFQKTFKQKEKVEEILNKNSLEKLITLYQKIKQIHKNFEIGVSYSGCHIFFYFIFTTANYNNCLDDLSAILVNNKHLNSNLIQIDNKISLPTLLKILNNLKNNKTFKKLQINSIIDDFTLKFIFDNLTTNNSLFKIDCSKLSISNETLSIFSEYLKFNQKVEKLNLEGNQIENFDLIDNVIIKNQSINFSSLNVSNNKFKSFGTLSDIINKHNLNNYNNLKKLKLSKCMIKNEEDFTKIFKKEKVINLLNLTTLDLSFNYVNIEILIDLITKNTNLNKLVLQKIKLDETGITKVSEFGKVYAGSKNIINLSINFDKNELISNFLTGFNNSENVNTSNKKNLKIFKSNINKETCIDLSNFIKKYDNFVSLDFSYCTIEDYDSFISGLVSSKHLENLYLSSCNLNSEELKNIGRLLAKNVSLKYLDLEKNSFDETHAKVLSESLNSSNITKLNLNYCFAGDCFKFFCENNNVNKGTNLLELSIENCEFSAENFGENLSQFLDKYNNIKILKIGSKDEIFKQNSNALILKSLANNKNLEHFSLTNIKLNHDVLINFLTILKNQLKVLVLNNICSNTSYFEVLASMKRLETVNLSIYGLSDDSHINFIKNLLLKNETLQHLIIMNSKSFNPEHLSIVLDGLIGNKKLKILDIFKNVPMNQPEYALTVMKYYKNIKDCVNFEKVEIFEPFLETLEVGKEKIEQGEKIFEDYFGNFK